MEESGNKGVEELIKKIKEYFDIRIKLVRLTLTEKCVLIFAGLITNGIVVIFLILAFLLISLGLGFYLSELFGNSYAGFFIMAIFYFILSLVIYLTKEKYLEKPIVETMIKKIFKDEEEGKI